MMGHPSKLVQDGVDALSNNQVSRNAKSWNLYKVRGANTSYKSFLTPIISIVLITDAIDDLHTYLEKL